MDNALGAYIKHVPGAVCIQKNVLEHIGLENKGNNMNSWTA